VASTNPEFNKVIVKVSLFKSHRQTVQFVLPQDAALVKGAAQLVIIDEAAAIPLSLVKSFFGSHLIFLASTVN
jgi:N-acetyltransferase 10